MNTAPKPYQVPHGHSATTMVVVIEVPEHMTEYEAQERVLQGFPEQIDGVPIFHVERTHGGVDADGVMTQPRVLRP